MDAVVALRHVSRRFGDRLAIDDISLEIRAGERVALIGPSGAGKTTLLRIMNGRLTPTAGERVILGSRLDDLRGHALRRLRRDIGTIDQSPALVDSLRVIHNVNAGHLGRWSTLRALVSLLTPMDRPVAAAALASLGIADTIDAPTATLSGGQRQRVAVARVLVQDPVLVLADEPVSHLDPERARTVLSILANVETSRRRALVVSLHRPDLAREFCDRIIGLRAGRILFDRAAGDVTAAATVPLYDLTDAA